MGRLDGFEREKMVPWKRAWYRGVVIAEYQTEGTPSYTFLTEDKASTQGDTRQIQICLTVANPNGGGKIETKTLNFTTYYRPDRLFDPEHVKQIMALRATEPKKGAWSNKDAQRDNMSFIAIHEIEKSINGDKELEQSEQGGLDLTPMIGEETDCFLSIYRKVEKNGKKVTDEVPKDLLDDYFTSKGEWGKGWFYGIKYFAVAGSQTDKASK